MAPASSARVAVQTETDERAHRGSHLLGLPDGQVAPLHSGKIAVIALLDDQGVDEPDDVALPESPQLRYDLAGEMWLVETDDKQLNWTDGHA